MELIEQEAFRRELLSLTYYGDGDYYSGREAERDAIIDRLNEQPTIDAAPVVHGRWVWSPEYCMWICSACGGREGECETPICQWCGARMDGGEGHEAG